MIQITVRPIDGSSPSEEIIQRPERPQRTNRPPSNNSPLQSFIIRTHAGQSGIGREELPRPNAPIQDENYNNRSISPLFAHQSTLPLDTNYIQRVVPMVQPLPNNAQICDTHSSRPSMIDLELSSTQPTGSNNQEFQIHHIGEYSNSINNYDHNNRVEQQQHNETQRQRDNWATTSNNINSDRLENPLVVVSGVGNPRRALLSQRLTHMENNRDEQDTSMPTIRNSYSLNHNWERDMRQRHSRPGAFGYTSPSSSNRPTGIVESWTNVINSRRPLRGNHPEHSSNVEPVPPLINLVEGEDEQETTSGTRTLPSPDSDLRWFGHQIINTNIQNASTSNQNANWRENRDEWEEDETIEGTLDDDDEIDEQHQEEEQEGEEGGAEDNEIVIGTSPNRPNNTISPATMIEVEGRTGPNSTGNGFRQLVLSALECPVCFDYVSSPIVLCYEGHLVCNRCRIRLSHCPECRGPFSNVRPRAIEMIANSLEYPCSYEGCTQLVTSVNRIIHAKTCSFRSFICPIAPTVCAWTGQKVQLRNHIMNTHGRHLHWISNSKLAFTIKPRTGKEKVFVMSTMDRLFLVKFTLANHKLTGCVTLLGHDARREETINVLVMVQASDVLSRRLMVTRPPCEESDEMDMRLEKFVVFNVSQLVRNNIRPSAIRIKVAICKRGSGTESNQPLEVIWVAE